jgi:hypothetical protein
VQAHALAEKEDIFYLTFFQELHDVARTNQVDDQLIRQRKDAFRSYQALTPPSVLTSDGEVIAGARTDATICRPARWSDSRFPPGPSKGEPASSWTWRRPISKRATSW